MVSEMTDRDPVAAERFHAGKTYDEYVASIAVNREKFADNLAKARVPEELAARYRALVAKPHGPKYFLAIGEDWCPDVYRGIPVGKRIADAMGIEMRILERDQHMDVMDRFKNGEFLSIPVFVFLDSEFRPLARFIERPKVANDQMREAMSPIFGPSGQRQLAEKLGRDPTEEEREAAKTDAARRYDEFQASSPYWSGWRDATVVEVLELLEGVVGD